MKRSTRIICLILAAVFVASLLISIAVSVAYAEGSGPSARGETVYVTADANGNVERVIASVYLSNSGQYETLTDHTFLTGIEAITTNDPPVIDGDSATFMADGEDVSYQGEARGEDLPFSVRITYFLDGKEIEPAALAGESGRVRIEVATENYLKEKVDVDGEQVELYVPFSIIGMLTLPESFSGVTAENAKLSSQAGQTTVMAVLLPGLAESLSVEKGDKINDTFAIEATVKDFSFDGGTFIGMTGIVDQNDLSGIDDVQDLTNALSELNDAAAELYDGARKLRNAMGTYEDGVIEYAEGVADAAAGVDDIADGVWQLYLGAGELADGSGTLTEGLQTLAGELEQAQESLNASSSAMSGDQIAAMIEQTAVGIAEQAIAAAMAEMQANLGAALQAALPPGTDVDAILGSAIPSGAPSVSLTPEQSAELAAQVNAMMQGAGGDMEALAEMLAQVTDAVEQLADGSDDLTDGVYDFADGIKELNSGIAEFRDGMVSLQEGGYDLADGADSIKDGLSEIASGLSALANEGLQEIVDETAEIDVSLSRKDALIALSEGYTSFSATRAPVEGSVQFMVTTEEIELELPLETEPVPGENDPGGSGGASPADTVPEEQGFFERIGAWFNEVFAAIGDWFE